MMIKSIRLAVGALVLTVAIVATAHAQDTGVSGFFHRAGAAIKQGASNALQGNSAGGQTNAAGVAETTGDIYKPLSSAHGEFVGLFNGVRNGQPWPRAALTFIEYGAALPCWTVRATIWRSASSHHDETFQACNAPVTTTDAVGNSGVLLAPNTGYVWMRQNVAGITHVQSSNDRTIGPNPPQHFFSVPLNAGPLETQYKNILFRLAWISGSISHEDASTTSGQFTLMWTAGFDPAGNRDHH